jgi:hypothetical protein
LSDERRHSAESRALLLSQATQLIARLGVRYRTGHQVGEVGEPCLAPGRKRFLGFAEGGDVAPDRPVDDDGSCDSLAPTLFPVPRRDRSWNV